MQSEATHHPDLAEAADKGSMSAQYSDISHPGLSRLLMPAGLFALVFATRIPFRTQYLFNWDSANFALALRHFDVTQHAPHPPGYPYFVLAGKGLELITGEANSALVLESILISALAVVALMALGQTMFSKSTGLVAALLLGGSVTFWTYGEIALAYTSLALFSSTVALFAYQSIFLGKDRGIPLALAYSIGGGFRPDLLLFLSPLLLASCIRLPRIKAIMVLAVAAAGVLLWLIPTVLLSGGHSSYLAVMQTYLDQDVIHKYSSTYNGAGALMVNVRDTAAYLFYSLYGTSVLFFTLITSWALGAGKMLGKRELFILFWLTPMVIFYLIVHVGDPGYVFSILPGVLLLLSHGLDRTLERLIPAAQKRWAPAGIVIIILSFNTGIFLLHQRPLTYWGLRQADKAMEAKTALLSSKDADNPPLALFYDSFRHAQVYLPDYRNIAWIDTAAGVPAVIPLPPGTRELLLMDNSLVTEAEALPGAVSEVAPGFKIKVVSADGRNIVNYDGRNLTLQ